MKFVNPFFAKKRRITELTQERNDLQTALYGYASDLAYHERELKISDGHNQALRSSNTEHQRINGRLRQANYNLDDLCDTQALTIRQDEQGLMYHMEEREELLDTIDELDEEAEALAETNVTLILDNIRLANDVTILNELLVEGAAAYDNVVEAGEKMVSEAQQGLDAYAEVVYELADLKREYDAVVQAGTQTAERSQLVYVQLRKDLAQANWAYEGAIADFNAVSEELKATKLANTQSLAWVRQAAEALDAYGITIEDTPVGPVVQIDRDAFVNRVALDNVTQA